MGAFVYFLEEIGRKKASKPGPGRKKFCCWNSCDAGLLFSSKRKPVY
jgi:hypothetical protein